MKQREPLVTHIFTADPSAHVFDDKIYVYPSHDLAHDGEDDDEGGEYLMHHAHDEVCEPPTSGHGEGGGTHYAH